MSNLNVGVYVDNENINRCGGRGMRMDILHRFACRSGDNALRMNSYLAFDEERAKTDAEYKASAQRYHLAIRETGFKVIEKPVQWYTNEDGVRVSKANSDSDLIVDMLRQSRKMDRIVLVSGDGDFAKAVRAVQDDGCRVEVIGFENVSYELRCEADSFFSGFLIPGLRPTAYTALPWGEMGSKVCGTCYHYNMDKGFGFMRYLVTLGDTLITDTRAAGSPYREAFFHRSQLPGGFNELRLPNRDDVFEFRLAKGREEAKCEGVEITRLVAYGHGSKTQAQPNAQPNVG